MPKASKTDSTDRLDSATRMNTTEPFGRMEDGTYNVNNGILRIIIRLLKRNNFLRSYVSSGIVLGAKK